MERIRDPRRAALRRALDGMEEPALSALLARMEDGRARLLLRLRHAEKLSWPELRAEAERRGLWYSERQLMRLYAAALEQAGRLLEADDAH